MFFELETQKTFLPGRLGAGIVWSGSNSKPLKKKGERVSFGDLEKENRY